MSSRKTMNVLEKNNFEKRKKWKTGVFNFDYWAYMSET